MTKFEELLTEYGDSLEEVRKIVKGMEAGGAKWNFEGEAEMYTSREAWKPLLRNPLKAVL